MCHACVPCALVVWRRGTQDATSKDGSLVMTSAPSTSTGTDPLGDFSSTTIGWVSTLALSAPPKLEELNEEGNLSVAPQSKPTNFRNSLSNDCNFHGRLRLCCSLFTRYRPSPFWVVVCCRFRVWDTGGIGCDTRPSRKEAQLS